MRKLEARLAALEAEVDDEGAIARRLFDIIRPAVLDGSPIDPAAAGAIMARLRGANDRRPSVFLAHLLRIGAALLVEKAADPLATSG